MPSLGRVPASEGPQGIHPRLQKNQRGQTVPSTAVRRSYRVVQRLDEKRFVIDVDGTPKIISTDDLKAAHLDPDPTPISQPSVVGPPATPEQSTRRSLTVA